MKYIHFNFLLGVQAKIYRNNCNWEMVFYTCNGCGESLKKNKVEKHVTVCRSCQYMTCMDCSKDFWWVLFFQSSTLNGTV